MDLNSKPTHTIYIQLLDEGTFSARPTLSESLGGGLYKVLATPDYDPEDEKWEFPPGSVVRTIEKKSSSGEAYPLAIKAT